MAVLRQQVVTEERWLHVTDVPLKQDPVPEHRTGPRRNVAEQRLTGLVRTIEAEVIPRLVLARRAIPGSSSIREVDGAIPSPEDVAHFATLVMTRDVAEAYSYVDAARGRGISVETLYLALLAPTAQRLRDLWDEDVYDFTDLTLGMCRLQQVLRELSPAFHNEVERREHGRRALLGPAPGEKHTFGQVMFGILMVAEFFRREGWDAQAELSASGDDLIGMVRGEWFDVIELLLGCESRLEQLASGIRAIRRASRNRDIGVMVGGSVFIERPELAAAVGADATAVDARQAALQADHLLALLARRY